MFEVEQNLNGVLNDVERLASLDIDNKTDTTSVVLEARIV
jgi:hypothetical protein